MVKAHFILKQFSYEKGFTDPSSTIYYCKNRFIFLVKSSLLSCFLPIIFCAIIFAFILLQIYKKYRFEQNKRTLFCSKWGKNIVSSKIKSGYSAQNTSKDPFRAK
mgnify:CR=1 FL=1